VSKIEKTAKTEYAERLRAFRKMAEVSQENLAKALAVHQPYIASIEAGNVSIGIDKLEEIAAYFGIKYYKFADPDYPIPPKMELRENIEKYVKSTHTETGYLKDESPTFSKHIDALLETDFLNEFRTARAIASACKTRYGIDIEATRVSDILSRQPRKNLLEVIKPETGKFNRYRLKVANPAS
jgi:transcriptional regulator with XRE-family HTH domain